MRLRGTVTEMRQRLVTIPMLLLVAVLANVGVAWGFALCARSGWSSETLGMRRLEDATWWGRRLDRPGEVLVGSNTAAAGPPSQVEADPDEVIPRWARIDAPPGTSEPGVWVSHSVYAFGWPFVAMCYDVRSVSRDDPPSATLDVSNGIVLDLPRQRGSGFVVGTRLRALPLRVLPLGAAANVLIDAISLWLVVVAPLDLRRRLRRRRGLCPSCAYPVGQSGVCSECGARVAPGAKSKA